MLAWEAALYLGKDPAVMEDEPAELVFQALAHKRAMAYRPPPVKSAV